MHIKGDQEGSLLNKSHRMMRDRIAMPRYFPSGIICHQLLSLRRVGACERNLVSTVDGTLNFSRGFKQFCFFNCIRYSSNYITFKCVSSIVELHASRTPTIKITMKNIPSSMIRRTKGLEFPYGCHIPICPESSVFDSKVTRYYSLVGARPATASAQDN